MAGVCPDLLWMGPFREDACHWTSSLPRIEQRRATSPNLSQTITAAVVTTKGYSCRPDLHRKQTNKQKKSGNLTSKGVIKPWRKFTLLEKIK